MREFAIWFVGSVSIGYLAVRAIPRVTRRSQALLIVMAGLGAYHLLDVLTKVLLS